MYSMAHLLELVQSEQAESLPLRVGLPPIFIRNGIEQRVESHPLAAGEAEELLRDLANTRQMRELWECGRVQFLHLFRRSIPFLVHAWVEDEKVSFDIQ